MLYVCIYTFIHKKTIQKKLKMDYFLKHFKMAEK